MQRKEGPFLQAPILPSHFWVPLLPSHLCVSVSNAFSWHLFLLKQKGGKKTIEKKTNAKKGRSFLLSSHFTLSLLGPASTFPLLPFCFKHFLRTSSSSQGDEKKEKTIEKKKKCKEGKELTFKLSLCPFTFGFCVWLLIFALSFQVFSPWHLFLFKQKKIKKKTKKKKTIEKNKMQKKGEFTFLLSLLHLG
jgi:hypothetical protein